MMTLAENKGARGPLLMGSALAQTPVVWDTFIIHGTFISAHDITHDSHIFLAYIFT
jgi:hypothetical protein